ncbi:MAG: class I SAM-dependent methyltransferase [Okeania sp. SIO3I5]|uniref:class I SAM-dependent methyltransferase n=1 Tax=Okeania sp. SIO3I5 TaxID=2607805 RepID=UPI0013BC2E52|nr:class I SAM-dependent methyltransferase [Okeania sp. SIO3I5]NEQ41663.1 class I SAM-dependent methyltransferase [Okeania sp. SIO3I5]
MSIGCGSGLFEKHFLKKLLEWNKSIHFVGVDPNKVECIKTQEWCQELSKFQPEKFTFKIHPVELEKFESSQSFDIILLIHSFYYFSEIESSFQKVYELIGEEGIAIIAVAVKTAFNLPFSYLNQRLYQRQAFYSEDLYQLFSEQNIPFRQETIEFLVNITKCFQKDSQFSKHLLDFIFGVDTTYFSPSQLQFLLDYLSSNSQKLESGEIMIPTSTSLCYFQKKEQEEEIKKENSGKFVNLISN